MRGLENEKPEIYPLNINRLEPNSLEPNSLELNSLELNSLELNSSKLLGSNTYSLTAEDLLRWWQQQQIHTLNQEADFIRSNILQEVFAVRRHLELAGDSGNLSPSAWDPYLTELKHVYSLLQQLSDRLDPPYLRSSFLLAIGHTIDLWRPTLPLKVSLPDTWGTEPISQTQLLLTLVNTMCRVVNESHPLTQSCEVSLRPLLEQKVLSLCVTYWDIPPPAVMAQLRSELAPIIQTFQLLSKGNFTVNAQPLKIAWTISWL